ncbi:hypothetical protein DID75_01825 [Candidatus Marinamargulisbacteria bacterium SCGC AG-410-N11]|nr:hypothetical protein DID75_01825 [Candidatus Marinamargulisbacteria bacterium SCGC AG-410-N11]
MDIQFPGASDGGLSNLQRVNKPKVPEETQHSQRNIKAPVTDSAKLSPAQTPTPTDKPAEAPKIEPQARPLSENDIVDQLFTIKKPLTSENKQIISTMIQYGVEANSESFDMIKNLLKGRKKGRSVDSAVISFAKGLSESGRSVDILAKFFANQIHLTNDMVKMQSILKQFALLLARSENLMSKGLMSGLSSIVSELDKNLKKLTKKSNDELVSLPKLKRSGLIQDLKLFFEFLTGVNQQLEGLPNSEKLLNLQEKLSQLKQSISSTLDSFLNQLILSKDPKSIQSNNDSYLYWQVPNPMTEGSKDLNIMIKKDSKGKNKKVNPDKTRIVLNFDTDLLGEISVIIDISNNKLWYVFKTSKGETKKYILELSSKLKEQMKALNYDVVGLQASQKRIDLKKVLIPTLNLDKMTRVITEV